MNLVLLSICYLSLLFLLAFFVERSKRAKQLMSWPIFYSLGLAVYCSAWTFYGSVGSVQGEGLLFLAISLGPALYMPLWYIVMRKLSKIVQSQGLSSLADILSARYEKSSTVGFLVTLGSCFGLVPYIALQLKAIGESSDLLEAGMGAQPAFWSDSVFYYALLVALFSMSFGTRRAEANSRRPALLAGIAFESLAKLFAMVAVGAWLFFKDWQLALPLSSGEAYTDILKQSNWGGEWFVLNLLSALAFLLLPRQVHVALIEQRDAGQLRQALWMLPLYLLIMSIFVLPLAVLGQQLLGTKLSSDLYILGLPLQEGQQALAFLVYLGGFSAASSMLIVSATALGIMLSNNLIVPIVLRTKLLRLDTHVSWTKELLWLRRLATLLLVLAAYIYYRLGTADRSLLQIGLNSFVAVAQFAPALLIGLYYKGCSKRGVFWGLGFGFAIWFLLLIVPVLSKAAFLYDAQGRYILHKYFLFSGLSAVSSTFLWSMLGNSLALLFFSSKQQSAEAQRQAELFVHIDRFLAEEGERAPIPFFFADLEQLLHRFLGKQATDTALRNYAQREGIDLGQSDLRDPKLLAFAESLLTGVLGAASTKLLLKSLNRAERVSLPELLDVLDESKAILALNKKLKEQSQQLEEAARALEQAHALKEEFLYIVTHELRTPLTSLRAFTEIIHDNPDMLEEERAHFTELMISELERLSRLINSVLDLEKYEAGKEVLHVQEQSLAQVLKEQTARIVPLAKTKGLLLHSELEEELAPLLFDRDKIEQVLSNLLSNALKYAQGHLRIRLFAKEGRQYIEIEDDGQGISDAEKAKVFDKFYQVQSKQAGKGSGLGLPIAYKIIELHGGKIVLRNAPQQGLICSFYLPEKPKQEA